MSIRGDQAPALRGPMSSSMEDLGMPPLSEPATCRARLGRLGSATPTHWYALLLVVVPEGSNAPPCFRWSHCGPRDREPPGPSPWAHTHLSALIGCRRVFGLGYSDGHH